MATHNPPHGESGPPPFDPNNPHHAYDPQQDPLHLAVHGSGDPDAYVLPVAGFKGTPDEVERQWFEQCYTGRGDTMWQLTWRAVLMGSALGGVLSLTNLYIGLKAGWGFGVAITACILSYAIWTTLHRVRLVGTPMSILENNCMQSTASSAGYSTGGTLVSAFAAYILLNDSTISYPVLLVWVFFLALLGVTMAIPMKRQMINVEQLRFPSGIAAAETLKALHTTGGKGMRSARALGLGALFSGLFTLWNELGTVLGVFGAKAIAAFTAGLTPSVWLERLSAVAFGPVPMSFTTKLVLDPIFLAAGIFTGMRVCASMLISGTLCWAIFVPIMLAQGHIVLTTDEPLNALPAGVNLVALNEGDGPLKMPPDAGVKYRVEGDRRFIRWSSVMTPEQRDILLAQSDDPEYRNAIARIYVRSQYRARIPAPGLPPNLQFPDIVQGQKWHRNARAVWYDHGTGELVSEKALSREQLAAVRALNAAPEFQAAVDELEARSVLPVFAPRWSSTLLDELPKDEQQRPIRFPREFVNLVEHDMKEGQLLWRGRMSPEQAEILKGLSADENYQAAVTALFAGANDIPADFPLPASAADVIRWDSVAGGLRMRGPVPETLAIELTGFSPDPAYQRTIGALLAAGTAGRAVANFRDLVSLTLWAGTACMVTSGLLSFGLQWRSALRAFSGLGAMFLRRRKVQSDLEQRMAAIETPAWWFFGAQLIALIGLAWLAHDAFGMPYWQSIVAVVLAFLLALVACRVTGETDTTPVGAMGKITQLVYGGLAPAVDSTAAATTRAMNINLMAANITAASAGGSADLLTDLKSGYLLGAHPRRQFIAQFAGIFVGTFVTVTCFSALVPSASILGSDTFPAPAALTWAAVAEALSVGLHKLSDVKIMCIAIGGGVGLILPILSILMPKYARFMPSAAGVGLAWTFHWYYSLMFFLGATIGLFWQRKSPKSSEEFSFPLAAGVVAGGSLVGVALILLENGPEIITRLLYGG
ncbi:MAG: OPT/YSL family transporter [Phycisphaerales bacterium]|nr:OPT/YSL family transporter [Phycisphaerales bacterium]